MTKPIHSLRRRNFLRWSAAGLAGLAVKPSLGAGRTPVSSPTPAGQPIVRTLGRTGLKLPVVSMGVMNSDNPNLIRAALDRGIVMLDTAHGYQRGKNEVIIGEVLKGRPRDSYIIATKVPAPGRDRRTGAIPADAKPEPFLEMFDISLQRLGVEYVDILYQHNVHAREQALHETVLGALQKIKKAGKARFIGVTSHANEPEVIRAAVEGKVHDVVLAAYNFRQDHRDEVRRAVAEAAAAGVGIVAMKTQAGAFWDKEKQRPINMKAALKWVLNDANVTTAIPGMTTFDQLEEDLAVMSDLTLTDQELQDLRPDVHAGLYCQHCNQCLPHCRERLPVPEIMRSYMYAYGYRNLGLARDLLEELDLPENPCRDCAACTVRCAKGFDVADRVKDVVRLTNVPAEFFG
ncbi:MAG: aldo/keto reductase [Candidatus Aminicenantes bacterium]|nr:aldo/keto reductase [Candidatus Aminicenantes bacterium]